MWIHNSDEFSTTERFRAQCKDLIGATNLYEAQTGLTKPRTFSDLQDNAYTCEREVNYVLKTYCLFH